MTYIDIIIIIPILWLTYKGFSRGFIRELTALAGLLIAIIGAIKFYDVTAVFLNSNLNLNVDYVAVIAFVATFIILLIFVNIIGRVLNKLIYSIHLGCIDKILGLVFGIISGAFIVAILINAFDHLNQTIFLISENTIDKSILYLPLNDIAIAFYEWFDFDLSEWGKKINEEIDKVKEKIS